jgi:hypothetical protein
MVLKSYVPFFCRIDNPFPILKFRICYHFLPVFCPEVELNNVGTI